MNLKTNFDLKAINVKKHFNKLQLLIVSLICYRLYILYVLMLINI